MDEYQKSETGFLMLFSTRLKQFYYDISHDDDWWYLLLGEKIKTPEKNAPVEKQKSKSSLKIGPKLFAQSYSKARAGLKWVSKRGKSDTNTDLLVFSRKYYVGHVEPILELDSKFLIKNGHLVFKTK